MSVSDIVSYATLVAVAFGIWFARRSAKRKFERFGETKFSAGYEGGQADLRAQLGVNVHFGDVAYSRDGGASANGTAAGVRGIDGAGAIGTGLDGAAFGTLDAGTSDYGTIDAGTIGYGPGLDGAADDHYLAAHVRASLIGAGIDPDRNGDIVGAEIRRLGVLGDSFRRRNGGVRDVGERGEVRLVPDGLGLAPGAVRGGGVRGDGAAGAEDVLEP